MQPLDVGEFLRFGPISLLDLVLSNYLFAHLSFTLSHAVSKIQNGEHITYCILQRHYSFWFELVLRQTFSLNLLIISHYQIFLFYEGRIVIVTII